MAASRFALRGVAGCLFLVLLSLVPAGARAADDEETRRLLHTVRRTDDPEKFAEAVRRLKAGPSDAQGRLVILLRKMAAERQRKLAGAVAKINEIVGRVGDGRKADERRQIWEEAKREAHAWLFNKVRFPAPAPGALVTGPQEGYGRARELGDAVSRAWKSLTRLLDRALAPAFRVSTAKAGALLAARDAARTEWHRVADELPQAERASYAVTPADPLAELLLGLRLLSYAPAAEAYAGQGPSWRKLCLFYAWSRTIVEANEDLPYGMSESAIETIVAINEYRVALGLSPMRHEPRLVRAARNHSEDMLRYRFFSHRSPVKGRKKKEDRVKQEGYEGGVVECIRGTGGGANAFTFWTYDGGHHRDMIEPSLVDTGMGTQGPAVYLGGKGGDDSLPALHY